MSFINNAGIKISYSIIDECDGDYLLLHTVFDVGLIISIIIHTMARVKIITKRNKIEKVWVDVFIMDCENCSNGRN
ncbi:MAG: hypothetical protein HGN29_17095, partial [Asgard group archaeon]|nr:hypothetical protein [Asgard group archaeon]